LLLLAETNLVHRAIDLLEVSSVINVVSCIAPTLLEKVVGLRLLNAIGFGGSQRIEGVVRSLVFGDGDHSTFFEEVADDVGTLDGQVLSEKYLHIFSESTRVVISDSLAVAKSLQKRVTGQYLLLDRVTFPVAQIGQHLHAVLCGFRLACSRLP